MVPAEPMPVVPLSRPVETEEERRTGSLAEAEKGPREYLTSEATSRAEEELHLWVEGERMARERDQ